MGNTDARCWAIRARALSPSGAITVLRCKMTVTSVHVKKGHAYVASCGNKLWLLRPDGGSLLVALGLTLRPLRTGLLAILAAGILPGLAA